MAARCESIFLERENASPILFHVYNSPAFCLPFVERFVKGADVRLAVVGPLAVGIGVMHDAHEARTIARGGPLQHLQIAVGVAEGKDGTPADMLLDTGWLAGLVVDEIDLGQLHEHRPCVAQLKLELAAAADYLLGRNAIDLLDPRAHEFDTAAGD